jgi:hypothetical protein
MATTLKQYLLIIVAALSLVLMPVAANAQYAPLSCDDTTGTVAGGSLFYADAVAQAGACQFEGIQHVFSQIVCNIMVILNTVVGMMYCGVEYAVKPMIGILMALFIGVFGIQLGMGTAQLNAKEVVTRTTKMGFIWMFGTQSIWAIGIIFKFFFGAAAQMTMWVLNSINPGMTGPNPDAGNFGNFMDTLQWMDNLIFQAISAPFQQANNTVLGFAIIVIFCFPSLASMGARWVLHTLIMVLDLLTNFILALGIIALLIGISPIFFCFLFFQMTAHLFEEWLKYMISYVLQIVVSFAILAMYIAVMSLFGSFFNDLANIVFPLQNVNVDVVFSPNNTIAICSYNLVFSPPGNPGAPCVAGQPCMPALVCDGSGVMFSPSQLQTQENFMYFMVYNLTALLLIAHAFGILAKNAPDIAKQLSGPASVPSLGGGAGMRGFGQMMNLGSGLTGGRPAAGGGRPAGGGVNPFAPGVGGRPPVGR